MDNKAFEEYGVEREKEIYEEKGKENYSSRVSIDSAEQYKKEPWNKRYKNAFKTFIPFRSTKPGPDRSLPLNDVGCVNYLTVGWITQTMWKAFRVGLVPTDLYEIAEPEDAMKNAERLERLWSSEIEKCKLENTSKNELSDIKKPSLSRVAWQFGRTRFMISLFLVVLSMFFQFVGPSILLNYLLDYLKDPTAPIETGITLLILFFLVQLFRNITFNLQQSIGIHTGIRLLSALEFVGYSKLLRLTSPNDAALGQLITFTTSDHDRIQDAVVNGALFIGTPIMFIMCLVYSLYLIGPSAIVGSVVVLLFYPIMGTIASLSSVLRLKVVTISDKRVTMMSEIINSMRLIKMYAWEQPFTDRINDLRKEEVKNLKKSALLQSLTSTISPSITIIAGFATFLTMTLAGVDLFTTEAFTILSIFNSMQFTIGTLPMALKMITEAHVGLRRLQELLEMKDYVHPSDQAVKFKSDTSINMKNVNLSWEVVSVKDMGKKKGKDKVKTEMKAEDRINYVPCLYDLSLNIKKGQLIGVAGGVGSGKSSLISAVMGEMNLEKGSMGVNGSLALVSQQTWIFNGTVRDNILMGSEFDSDWYKEVIEACALTSDFKMLAQGDQTEVGERGVTLSGGQKQRVNLARALYADLDIYLLDDPLSAVDAKVGQHIFNKYIQVMLKNKTVLLVTHGMQFLKQCDWIVYMSQGKIVESGLHVNLVGIEGGLYANMVLYDAKRNNSPAKQTRRNRTESVMSIKEEEVLQKINNDEKLTKSQGWITLIRYLKECGNGFIMTFIFFSIVVFIISRLMTSIWVQIWMDAGDGLEDYRKKNESFSQASDSELRGLINDNPKLWIYQLVYGIIILAMMVFGILKGAGLLKKLMEGNLKIHQQMLTSIMRSPMAFFDVTPSGRILNRFSKDMDVMDTRIPHLTEMVTQFCLIILSQVSLVCVLYPYFAIGFLVIAILFVLLDFTMNSGVLESKKLDNIMKSAVIHHISSSMSGVNIIRGFSKEEVFKKRFNTYLNASMSADSLFRLATRWFMWRIESLALLTITLSAVTTVVMKGSVSPAIAGLALASIFQTCTLVPFAMKFKSEFTAMLSSLERNFEYMNLPQEAPHVIENKRPPAAWPQYGRVKITNMSFKYRPDLPLVLKNISIDIRGGQKVGIVGRTGAGKSSFISTLLRLVELEEGDILVDGINISEIGLTDLRSAVAVIPQDPVLFQGTVRYNIDPFDSHTDEEVWQAIEASNLKEKVCAENKQLNMIVEAEGDNFSVGEKQLICLARALLRKNKILLLDEATASVDVKTDHLIQCTIQSAFSDCTVLTIAHRLNTILAYDMVMVLDQGKLVEIGSPGQLMEGGGIFEGMARAAGLKN